MDLPTKNLRIQANFLAVALLTVPLLETMSLKGSPFFVDFWEPIEFGWHCPWGYSLLYVSSLIPPSALMGFSILINLFFCILVRSVDRILYVGRFNGSFAFLIYSSLFITTKATPLSLVKINLESSFFNSLMALLSSLLIWLQDHLHKILTTCKYPTWALNRIKIP